MARRRTFYPGSILFRNFYNTFMKSAPYSELLIELVQSPGFVRATLGGTPRLGKTLIQRVQLRAVQLAEGRRLQVSRFDEKKDLTSNHRFENAAEALAEMIRAVKTSPAGNPAFLAEYAAFKSFTGVTPISN